MLDREFSYLELQQALVQEEVAIVMRLKLGASFYDLESQLVALSVKNRQTRLLNKVSTWIRYW